MSSKFDFLYHIHISNFGCDNETAATESTRKRKLLDDGDTSVNFTWIIFRKCYCYDDPSSPMVDMRFKTAVFKDIEFRRINHGNEHDYGVVDLMVRDIGRPVYGDYTTFEEVYDMVLDIRRSVVTVRNGPRREKLNVMITLTKQIEIPVEEYEEILQESETKS